MAVNETIVEVVKFVSRGVPEVIAQTKVMNRETDAVTQKYTALVALANNPAFVRHAANLDRMAKSHELIGMRLRNQAYAQRMADGSAARQIRAAEVLNRRYAEMQRRTEYIAKYGETTGRFLDKYGAALGGLGRFAGGAAIGGVATVGGLAHRGLEGTVQKARFDNEMGLLSRELGNVFAPLLTLATKLTRAARKSMERASRDGQDALMLGGLGITAGLATAYGIGGRFGMRAGLGVAGAGVGAAGIVSGNPYASAAGGAMLGWSVGGPWGAAIGAGVGYTAGYVQKRGDYGKLRQKGYSKFGAGLGTAAAVGFDYVDALLNPWDTFGKTGGGDNLRELMGINGPTAKPAQARRMAMIAGGGWEEQGAGFHRLNAAVSKMEGGGEDDFQLGPTLGKIVDLLGQISAKLGGDDEIERSGADA